MSKKEKKTEKKIRKHLVKSFKQGWDDYYFFEKELEELEAQYNSGVLKIAQVAQRLGKYDTYKKILALVVLDKKQCKHIPLEVLEKTCFLDLLRYIDSETFRYAIAERFRREAFKKDLRMRKHKNRRLICIN